MTTKSNPHAHHQREGFMVPSFGRRRGRPLRPAQQKLMDEWLPQIALNLDAAGKLHGWPEQAKQRWLEIGFGAGEHMIARARANPDVTVIGCEVFLQSFAIALSTVARDRIGNVRLCQDDARLLLDAIPENSLDRAFILFPDPWPKKRNHKRRIVNTATLDQMARILKPGGELLLATDILDYAGWMLEHALPHPAFEWLAESKADWLKEPDGWVKTRYQKKAEREGRYAMFLRFVRR